MVRGRGQESKVRVPGQDQGKGKGQGSKVKAIPRDKVQDQGWG